MDNPTIDSSQPRLTRGEYWLLETVVDLRVPLHFLEADGYSENSSIELMFNKPGHGLARAQLLECLHDLFHGGLIAVSTFADEPPWLPTDEQMAAALCAKRSDKSALYYGLTEKGGAVWETFAVPDWDRFILEDFDNENHTGKVMCATLWRLERYLGYFGLNLLDQTIDSDTVQIQDCGPWQATYWKQLPQGFCARFACGWTERGINRDQMKWLAFGGLCAFRDGWYRWR